MCDYSLHGVASRPAKVGDALVTMKFEDSYTRGFADARDPGVVVCLLPGTELAFEQEVECERSLFFLHTKQPYTVARFRHVDVDKPYRHHDALEFPNGKVVLVTLLRRGQQATVLQLPSMRFLGDQSWLSKSRNRAPYRKRMKRITT